jgi:hypothetical protein
VGQRARARAIRLSRYFQSFPTDVAGAQPDQYAKELSDTNVLINNTCSGYVATDLNAFHGTQTPEQGSAIAIRLATLPDDGPTGGLSDNNGIVPW